MASASQNLRTRRDASVRNAILRVLPTEGEGMTHGQLIRAVRPLLPLALFPQERTVRWYTRTVQHDLEARRIVRRVSPRSLRLLRSLPDA